MRARDILEDKFLQTKFQTMNGLNNILNPIIAVLLLLCLANMPYGYYALVRFVSMVAFSVMAYQYWNKKQQSLAVAFGA